MYYILIGNVNLPRKTTPKILTFTAVDSLQKGTLFCALCSRIEIGSMQKYITVITMNLKVIAKKRVEGLSADGYSL